MEPPLSEKPPEISQQPFDFKTDRVAGMDLPTLENEIGNLMSGDPSHPYLNSHDGRHKAAVAYGGALFQRRAALGAETAVDAGAVKIAEMQVAKRRQAEELKTRLRSSGFEDFELPAEIDDVHLELMQRSLLIGEGKLSEAVFHLQREARRHDLDREPAVASLLEILEHGTSEDLDRNPHLRSLLTDAAISLQQIVSGKAIARHAAAKAHVEKLRKERGGGRL